MAADHQTPHRFLEDELKDRLVGLRQLAVAEVNASEFALDQDDLMFKFEPALWLANPLGSVSLVKLNPLMVDQ